MTDYYWAAAAAGNASVGGNWSPSGPPGSADTAIFTNANSDKDCSMNITSVGEVEVRDDYDGTITLANNFTINNTVDNVMEGLDAAAWDCAGYDFTVSGTLQVGNGGGSNNMFFYPDTGAMSFGAATTTDNVLYINGGRLYGVNPDQTGADGDWDIYGSFRAGNSAYINFTEGLTTFKSYQEDGFTTDKDKIISIGGLGWTGSCPGRILIDLETVNSDGDPYAIDIGGASGSYMPINQLVIRTSGATFRSNNGLTINDMFVISGGTYDTLDIGDDTTSTPLMVATGTFIIGGDRGDLAGYAALVLNDSQFTSYTDLTNNQTVGNKGESSPEANFAAGGWASLCLGGSAVISGGTAEVITLNTIAYRNGGYGDGQVPKFYLPTGAGSLTLFGKNYNSYSCLTSSNYAASALIYIAADGSIINVRTNASSLLMNTGTPNEVTAAVEGQTYNSDYGLTLWHLNILEGYNGVKSYVKTNSSTYTPGAMTLKGNLYIQNGCSFRPRYAGNVSSSSQIGGTRCTLWVDGDVLLSGSMDWDQDSSTANTMYRYPNLYFKSLTIADGGSYKAPPRLTNNVSGSGKSYDENGDSYPSATFITGRSNSFGHTDSWRNISGSFTANSGSVYFSGSGDMVVNNIDAKGQFYNFYIDNSSGDVAMTGGYDNTVDNDIIIYDTDGNHDLRWGSSNNMSVGRNLKIVSGTLCNQTAHTGILNVSGNLELTTSDAKFGRDYDDASDLTVNIYGNLINNGGEII